MLSQACKTKITSAAAAQQAEAAAEEVVAAGQAGPRRAGGNRVGRNRAAGNTVVEADKARSGSTSSQTVPRDATLADMDMAHRRSASVLHQAKR
jgi:hypothetical protein